MSFEQTFRKKNKKLVLNSYFLFLKGAKFQKHENKTVKIHAMDYENMSNLHDMWKPMNHDHPTIFEAIVMESDQKYMILRIGRDSRRGKNINVK